MSILKRVFKLKLVQKVNLFISIFGPLYISRLVALAYPVSVVISLICFICGCSDCFVNYCAGNDSDLQYFQDQLTAAQEAETLWHKSKTQSLSSVEEEVLKDFISTMDEPKTKFGLTDQDFKREHANAKAGLIKAGLESKTGSDFQGRRVETEAAGSKHTLESTDNLPAKKK